LGLTLDALAPLKELGNIRNAFGHRLGVSLTKHMVESLWTAFPDRFRAATLQGHAAAKALSGTSFPPFEQLGPRDKFIAMAASLDKMLVNAHSEFRRDEPSRA